MPKLRLDLTSDEALVAPPVLRPIGHPYRDVLPQARLLSHPIAELFGEKSPHARERKCEDAGIEVPSDDTIRSSPFRTEIEEEWENMLGHQLPRPLLPFSAFWSALDRVFGWLDGSSPTTQLPRAGLGQLDTWEASQAISSWHQRFPLELLRYAGANRLKVEIAYGAALGRQGPRVVEPYSLRRTADGHLVLLVVNDRGQLRSYRVDHIVGIRPTESTFTPGFRVEF